MSETPRTHAKHNALLRSNSARAEDYIQMMLFAEELEQELTLANERAEQAEAKNIDLHGRLASRELPTFDHGTELDDLRRAIAAKDAALMKVVALCEDSDADRTRRPKWIDDALSPDAGNGWLGPEEVFALEAKHLLERSDVSRKWSEDVNKRAGELMAMTISRDAWREDAMRLAEPLEEFRRQRHEVQLGVPDEVTTALAAHDALVAKEKGTV